MAGELYRVVLRFRSNFDKVPEKVNVERYVSDYLQAMQGIGQILEVEVVALEPVIDVATVTDRITIPAPALVPEPVPAPVSDPVPAVIVSEPDTGRRTKIPGTGDV
jgi:hypothetical protein